MEIIADGNRQQMTAGTAAYGTSPSFAAASPNDRFWYAEPSFAPALA